MAQDIGTKPPWHTARVYRTWFARLVWLGIVLNLVIALFGLIAPGRLLPALNLTAATPEVWPRFASLLLILLSAFYVMAALDPARHRFAAILTVAARAVGVVFFTLVGGAYTTLAFYDLALGLPQAVLLWLAYRKQEPRRRRLWQRLSWPALVALVFVVLPAGLIVYDRIFREDFPQYAALEDHFKYGSIGNDHTDGLPYWIWLVLPRVFPEYLPRPGGYETLGFQWEPGRQVPIGLSKVDIGFPRVAINCAVCHIASWRERQDDIPVLFPGGVSSTVNLQAYLRFLGAAASDPRFNADTLLQAIGYEVDLDWVDRLLYRHLIIPLTREALLQQKAEFAWTDDRPNWGAGRVDPFNPVKFSYLRVPMDETIGNADIMPAWNLDAREAIAGADGPLHWDGLNTSIWEVVLNSALGDGMTGKYFDPDALKRMEQFLRETAPPAFPYLYDSGLAEQGAAVFERHCAECHGAEGKRTYTLIPLEEIGTDGHRAEMWNDQATENYNNYTEGYDWNFTTFQNVEAYIAEMLDGIWLRAPYLHNGSVPTLRDLLNPPEQRTKAFYRGYDVYDPVAVGFVSSGPEAARVGTLFDTREQGNSNAGHLYGTDLGDAEKAALVEYMKTL